MSRYFSGSTSNYALNGLYGPVDIVADDAVFTFAGWFMLETKPTVYLNEMMLFKIANGGGVDGYQIRVDDAGNNFLNPAKRATGNFITYNLPVELSTNRWYHAAWRMNGNSGQEVFLDGAHITTEGSNPGGTVSNIQTLIIGALKQNSVIIDPYKGWLGEFGFYRILLSNGEIQALFGGVRPDRMRRQGEMFHYFPLDERNASTAVLDKIGGFDCTINGTVEVSQRHPPIIDPFIRVLAAAPAVVAGVSPAFLPPTRRQPLMRF